MKLVIAEKPSVAQAIGNVLGATNRKDGYLEGNNYIITWCIGHLVGLASTESYDEKYKKWDKEDLPIIPEKFLYVASKNKYEQLKLVCSLINKKEVDCIINACDAGREGELIFRRVYNYSKSNKSIKRLWISSMEDTAIKEGFDNLKDGKDFELLHQAAQCRAMADWIVGINATRLFSLLYNDKLNVGRVMSPTLAMIVERNANINAFESKPFYNVILNKDGAIFSSEKLSDEKDAKRILGEIKAQTFTISTLDSKDRIEKTPTLYDLTTLQREANRKLGYTASQTLEYTQSLYEKKIVTYPRTDSKFLTEDMFDSISKLAEISAKKLNTEIKGCNEKQVINNSKVSDHHGIIPTKSLESYDIENLPKGEKEVLTLIMLRLLCAIGKSYKYSETTIVGNVGEHSLTCKGKTIIDLGFKAYLKDDKQDDVEKFMPKFSKDETIDDFEISIKEGKTTPPKQYTEDTILSAMETAGRDENVDKDLCGIGTPATRAGIIEKLIAINLIERKGDKKVKYLIPTDKGNALITVLPEDIASPITTIMWEEKLRNIELDDFTSEEFMNEISEMINNLVKNYRVVEGSDALFSSEKKEIGNCPRCNNSVVDTKKAYVCSDSNCAFILWKENKYFTSKRKKITEKVAVDLLTKGYVKMKGCYSEKTGKTYDCIIKLDDNGGKYVNFAIEFENKNK